NTGSGSNIWVFDRNYKVLAGGYLLERDSDISALEDYKGRPLAASIYQEVRVGGSAFSIYRLPVPGTDTQTLRYAYVSYFPEWDWVVAVSDDAEGVVQQFERRRSETESAIADVIDDLRLAESGFVFVLGSD